MTLRKEVDEEMTVDKEVNEEMTTKEVNKKNDSR
jgi:hypothetical protein